MRTAVHAYGAQINVEDLTSYLIYETMEVKEK
jgi:hypothetical protein